MPITSFKIENEKIIRLAECEHVPKVMIIAGPNGVGKSTLLYTLKEFAETRQGVSISGNPKILYIGPHRIWRPTLIPVSSLVGKEIRQRDVLEQVILEPLEKYGIRIDDEGGFPPISSFYLHRRYNYPDESPVLNKLRLGMIELRRRFAIAKRFDKNESITKSEIPDIYRPLKELISFFLPYLRFDRIEIDPEQHRFVKVIFQHLKQPTLTGYLELDIDDLSSGEKELIAFFLPIVEAQIERELTKIEGKSKKSSEEEIIILIDSPEMHLHPALQSRFLEYMRELSERENIQFIVVTHSPILVNEAKPDELYIMLFPDQALNGNQLVKVSDDADKLYLIRDLLGDLSLLATGKPILLLEDYPDIEILKLLMPDIEQRFTLLPIGGKGKVLNFIKIFNKILPELIFSGFRIFAILDRDRKKESESYDDLGIIFYWPVACIENLLLVDSEAIYKALEVVAGANELASKGIISPEQIDKLIDEILADPELRIEEIRKRIGDEIIFRCSLRELKELSVETIRKTVEGQVKKKLERITEVFENCEREVQEILNDKTKVLRELNGKFILGKIAQKFGVEREILARAIAKELRNLNKVPPYVYAIIEHITNFIPKNIQQKLELLTKRLEELNVDDKILMAMNDLKAEIADAIKERELLEQPKIDRKQLRSKIIKLCKEIEEAIKDSESKVLINEIKALALII